MKKLIDNVVPFTPELEFKARMRAESIAKLCGVDYSQLPRHIQNEIMYVVLQEFDNAR